MSNLTILMVTKNRVGMFYKALKSIQDQTTPEYIHEVLIIDNNSTKLNLFLKVSIATFLNLVSPFRIYISSESKLSLGKCRDNLIRATESRYYTFLDDDDEFHPQFVHIMTPHMLRGRDLIYTHSLPEMETRITDSYIDHDYQAETSKLNLIADFSNHKNDMRTKFYPCNGGSVVSTHLYISYSSIKYGNHKIYDDTAVMLAIFFESKKVTILQDILYRYTSTDDDTNVSRNADISDIVKYTHLNLTDLFYQYPERKDEINKEFSNHFKYLKYKYKDDFQEIVEEFKKLGDLPKLKLNI